MTGLVIHCRLVQARRQFLLHTRILVNIQGLGAGIYFGVGLKGLGFTTGGVGEGNHLAEGGVYRNLDVLNGDLPLVIGGAFLVLQPVHALGADRGHLGVFGQASGVEFHFRTGSGIIADGTSWGDFERDLHAGVLGGSLHRIFTGGKPLGNSDGTLSFAVFANGDGATPTSFCFLAVEGNGDFFALGEVC